MSSALPKGHRSLQVFLITPIAAESDVVAEALQRAASLLPTIGLHLDIRRGDKVSASPDVIGSIRGAICDAEAVVADLTGVSPNVLWELGYAQALQKPVVLITRDLSEVPFDLKRQRVTLYEHGEPSFLTARFVEAFQEIAHGHLGGAEQATNHTKGSVFLSYSHADVIFLKRILVHLRPLERDGLIDLWADTKIAPGDRWREEIRTALGLARVAILLVSADFLASEFITTDELPPLLAAAEKRGTRIIPLIAKPSRFLRDPRLSRFQAINDPAAPLIGMNEADREWVYARLAEIVEADVDSPAT